MRPALATLVIGLAATGPAVEFTGSELRAIQRLSPVGAVPPDPTNAWADDPDAAQLGQYLFFDTRLSASGEIACATCHDPTQFFADGKPVAEGMGVGTRNTPSLVDVAHQRWFFLDGRADTLWSQALQPIERDIELGSSRRQVAQLVVTDADIRAAYEHCFGPLPDGPDAVDRIFVNVGKAIAAYERRLRSGATPFDVFAEGLRSGDADKLRALAEPAQRGLKLFLGKGGCRMCHIGPMFSDGEFHSVGVPPRGGGLPRDAGRYRGADQVKKDPFNAGGVFSDDPDGATATRVRRLANGPDNWGRFRTPSLRNVARTAPYMHAGQYATLGQVLEHYSTLEDAVQLDHHQEQVLQPLNLTPGEIADLTAFLESLTGSDVAEPLLSAPPSARPSRTRKDRPPASRR